MAQLQPLLVPNTLPVNSVLHPTVYHGRQSRDHSVYETFCMQVIWIPSLWLASWCTLLPGRSNFQIPASGFTGWSLRSFVLMFQLAVDLSKRLGLIDTPSFDFFGKEYVIYFSSVQYNSIQFSHSIVSNSLQPHSISLSCSTSSWSLLKLMFIELVMPSNHLIFCHPLLLLPSIFVSIRVFSNELVLCIRWPNIVASASTSVLSMNIQGWFPLGLTDLISL